MGLYHYSRPTTVHLDQWLSEGRVYERAYSPVSYTTPSEFSFLTGLSPQNHGIRMLCQKIYPEMQTITRRLEQAGYQTSAIVSNGILTREATGLDEQFQYYDDYLEERKGFRKVYDRGAEGTTNAALKWFAAYRDDSRPYFMWIHYMDPHAPYIPPESKPADFSHPEPVYVNSEKRIKDYVRLPGVNDALEYVDRYDEEIAYADAQIFRLLDEMTQAGLLDHTLVIFTADHGETMTEHEQWFSHRYHVYEELVRVPLVLRGPGISATRVAQPVTLMDIVPTILQYAGMEVPEGLDGILLSDKPPARNIFFEANYGFNHQWRGVVRGQEKWMASVRDREPSREIVRRRYYNLATDPGEKAPMEWPEESSRNEAVQEMLQKIADDADLGRELPVRFKT